MNKNSITFGISGLLIGVIISLLYFNEEIKSEKRDSFRLGFENGKNKVLNTFVDIKCNIHSYDNHSTKNEMEQLRACMSKELEILKNVLDSNKTF